MMEGAPVDATELQDLMSEFYRAGWNGSAMYWALLTALATHAAPVPEPLDVGEYPDFHTWPPRDDLDWITCGYSALTDAAIAMAREYRRERKSWLPKWRIANDEGKLRVQEALRQEFGIS
jgi:hypothetical protein